jgi:molybdopterin/thiamine biosynthesis adenylyltransferase
MGLYDRQASLGLNIKQSLAIVGCGGIGYWVAKFAAMSGIEKLYLFDPDVLEETNLNRIDVPDEFLGMNKAVATKNIINRLRPDCTVYAFPFILQEHTFSKVDWLVDCTDKMKSQLANQEIAKKFGSKYLKAGYDGESMSISDSVAEWGEAQDGYVTIPSWVVPASVVSAMTVAKILKYNNMEMATELKKLFNYDNVAPKRR